MRSSPHSPRRQRRALYNADTFERRKRMSVPLSRQLRTRFKTRSAPLRKGDTVRVRSGSFKGREERVAKVDRRSYSVTLDNVTLKTAGEKLKPLPITPSHLVITRLNLADPWRRRSLRVRDEDVTPEELGEPEAPVEETVIPAALPAPADAAEPAEAPAEETDPSPTPTAPKRRARPPSAEESK
ncbi:MAG: 50S ribosomal protein L24 [Thermoplasmata archaeon]